MVSTYTNAVVLAVDWLKKCASISIFDAPFLSAACLDRTVMPTGGTICEQRASSMSTPGHVSVELCRQHTVDDIAPIGTRVVV